MQATPAVQETHAPARQARLVPQLAPSGWKAVSVQTGTPEPQLITAVRAQGFVDGQASASAAGQVMQAPPPHTRFVPQIVPSGISASGPPSRHVSGVPQATVPVWQGLAGTQAPAAQGVGRHDPLVQAAVGEAQVTVVVPSATLAVARHTGTPVLQSMAAVATHAFSRVHAAPWVQATHAPALQTRFVPQLVPVGWSRVVSTQTDVPVAQEVAPV